MSVPARKVVAEPDLRPRTPAPARRSAPRSADAKRTRSARRAGFTVFAGAVLAAMLMAVVALNALLAQAAFRIDELESRIATLSETQLTLQMEQARLSAPGTVAAWARREGMQTPEPGQVHMLRVGIPNRSPVAPRGSSREGPK